MATKSLHFVGIISVFVVTFGNEVQHDWSRTDVSEKLLLIQRDVIIKPGMNIPHIRSKFDWITFGNDTACEVGNATNDQKPLAKINMSLDECKKWCETSFGCQAAQYRQAGQLCKLLQMRIEKALHFAGHECIRAEKVLTETHEIAGRALKGAVSNSRHRVRHRSRRASSRQTPPSWHTVGKNTACHQNNDTLDDFGASRWYTHTSTKRSCAKVCEETPECTGVEWHAISGTCGVWTSRIKTAAFDPGFECLVYTSEEEWQRNRPGHIAKPGRPFMSETEIEKLFSEGEGGDENVLTSVPHWIKTVAGKLEHQTQSQSSPYLHVRYCGFKLHANAQNLKQGANCLGGDDCRTDECENLADCVKMCNGCDQCRGVQFQPNGGSGIRCRLLSAWKHEPSGGYVDAYDWTEESGWGLYVNNRDVSCADAAAQP